jgi:lambda repressor-like predicted transcriptional regulator
MLNNHGTLTTYKTHACRCVNCATVANTYQKRLRLDHARGRKRVVSADRAHAHVSWLRSQGMTWAAIADAMGYSSSTVVHRITRRDRIRVSTLGRLLAVQPRITSDRSLVSSAGARRRLRALACAGWSLADVSRRTGIASTVLSDVRRGRYPETRAYMDALIRDVYAELAYMQGGSSRARLQAERAGWAPAAAWDDIDDPQSRPMGVRRAA